MEKRKVRFLFDQFSIDDNSLAGMTFKNAGNFFARNQREADINAIKVFKITGFPYLSARTIIMHAVHEEKVIFSGRCFKTSQFYCDGVIFRGKGAAVFFSGGCATVAFRDKKADISGLLHAGWRSVSLKIVEKFLRKWERVGGNPDTTIVHFLPAACGYGLIFDNDYFKNIVDAMPYNLKGFAKKINKDYVGFSLVPLVEKILNEHRYVVKTSRECVCCSGHFWYYRRDDKNGVKYRNAAFIITR